MNPGFRRRPPPVYLDNAATSWPKPPAVSAAVQAALRDAGGNPGRGGHPLAVRAGKTVYHARETAAALFRARPEHIVFTQNCTHALNLAVYGTLRQGDHIILSDLEHNAAARPVYAMAEAGIIRYSVAHISADTEQILRELRTHLRRETRAVLCTAVSNVTGQILPRREIAEFCRENGLILITDGAQGCGILPVTLDDGMQLLCTAGHKGLYGPMGTGILISDGTVPLRPLMQGGTGSLSASLTMPDFLPDMLEPGTVNVPGIAGLDAGMQYVMQRGTAQILRHEQALCRLMLDGLRRRPDIRVLRENGAEYAPVISFLREGEAPEQTAARLTARGICVRAGLHCAPLAHQSLNTAPAGTVRVSPSVMNTAAEAEAFLRAV
ncbi:MAG: aminotransferase class V-fold PLP-dependent enzyme [Oscillospiraceae bacterium]|nr:aminotransferase class V-fold PLP-dependent enzyme [Oscillospiraceae bacterium]